MCSLCNVVDRVREVRGGGEYLTLTSLCGGEYLTLTSLTIFIKVFRCVVYVMWWTE